MGPVAAAMLALTLVVSLFVIAAWVERHPQLSRRTNLRHAAYTLSLAVYCTSWTFYGAVGSAARDGWSYLPIYAAPIAVVLLAPRFLMRMARAVREEKATTISDFIASRFGHDVTIARLVTVIAVLGSIPYIALQIRSIGTAYSIVSGGSPSTPAMLGAAPVLALFAILFGVRRYEVAGRSEGLLFSIAAESLIKLVALLAVGVFAVVLLIDLDPEIRRGAVATLAANFQPSRLSGETFVIALLAGCAIIALPRQFYMGLVEAHAPDDLARARFGFAAYLAIMTVVVLPITAVGLALLPGVSPDSFVLALPLGAGNSGIATLAFVGGISAATAMVIVESTALATMVSNDLIAPALVRRSVTATSMNIGKRLMLMRRGAVLAIVAAALIWALSVPARQPLAWIGLIAFAAMAQFTPHLLLATTGSDRNVAAGRASLSVGLALWLYTLAMPPFLPTEWLAMVAGTAIDPQRLLGIGHATPLVHGVVWSLGANLATYAAIAAGHGERPAIPRIFRPSRRVANLADLADFCRRFVGVEAVREAFGEPVAGVGIDRRSARKAERLVAQVVGASSARALIASALAGERLSHDDVARLLDEGGQSLRFSRRLLAATLENIDSGVSVIDADLNLVAWNSRYLELFAYPDGMVSAGTPVAELIRYNATRGECGPGEIDDHVEKRLSHLRRGLNHSFERRRDDDRVIKTVGGPMPGGGYIMSFTDITAEAAARDELERTLDELEIRVAARTDELSRANAQLALATAEKTRFLAAASHDLLQPLHAARLFAAALDRDASAGQRMIVDRIGKSIVAAEELLRALLDISKLDAGGVEPTIADVPLPPLIRDIAEGMRPLAEDRALSLRIGPLWGTARTDAAMLRSVIQNLLSNALRYTESGGVLIGMRRSRAGLRIDVVDTGSGIPADKQQAIFGEFTRLGNADAEGLGLGLAIVDRIARLIDARIAVRSVVGRGSCFSIILPAGSATVDEAPAARRASGLPGAARILVVDNDPDILDATRALLEGMGHRVTALDSAAAALAHEAAVDLALIDYHLGDGASGLDIIDHLRRRHPNMPIAIVSADTGAVLREGAAARAIEVMRKPINPARLEDFINAASVTQIEA